MSKYKYVVVGIWIDGVHTGKERRVPGHDAFETEMEAIETGLRRNPIGHIYRHGSTGNRWKVTSVGNRRVRSC